MSEIVLTDGQICIVDDSDFEWLSQWKWHRNPNGYAARRENNKSILMHRVVNNTPDDKITDHINGVKLDNRRNNLRTCTDGQNMMNRRKHKVATSKYKGVSRSSGGRNGWEVMLYLEEKRQYIGHFSSEIDAALAYNEAAKKVFGDFAHINNVEIPEDYTPAPRKEYSSKYIGVCWNKASQKWLAKIKKAGKQTYLGLYDNEDDAGAAYQTAALERGAKAYNYTIKQQPR